MEATTASLASKLVGPVPAGSPRAPALEDRPAGAGPNALYLSLKRECEAMLRFALDHGRELSPELIGRAAYLLCDAATDRADAAKFAGLVSLHSGLAAAVAPASGRTLVLFEEERAAHPGLYVFGPVRLVRQMLAFAVLALIVTGALSTSQHVNIENLAKGWFALSGHEALGVLGFLVSVAGLGAAFANLWTVNTYIEDANYDTKYEGSYWVRIVLGLISGVVLAEVLFDIVMQSNVLHSESLAPAGERIVLAFIGGFATSTVYRLLTNLMEAIGALFQGGAKQEPAAQRTQAALVPVAITQPAPETGASA